MKSRRNLHSRLLCGAAGLTLFAIGVAHAEETARYNIPPQSLNAALREFGYQSGHTILVDAQLTGAKKTRGLTASSDAETALRSLLEGTGLSYTRDGDVFAIVAVRRDAAVRRAPVATIAAAETVSGSAVEGLVVTAQKRREKIQDVPIAISAFSADALQAQKIEGGFDLLKAIPNVTFSKNNFTSYNFSIRGIGTKAVSATTDPGVAVSFNNTTLIQNRLFEQEYFDIERVEVLRGPQGTLYGRNATSGVINIITEKADSGAFDGWIKGELGNYDTKRLSGMINVPLIEDVLAVRFAGATTTREGYDFNEGTGNPVNGRDLWSGRLSIAFDPIERVHADFVWERFNEDDNRSRTGKQLCHHDSGPSNINGVQIVDGRGGAFPAEAVSSVFSQGCLPGSLYDDGAFGTPNGLSLPFVFVFPAVGDDLFPFAFEADGRPVQPVGALDPYGGKMQSHDLRTISSFRDPVYRAAADVFQLNIDVDLTDHLTLSSQTVYNKDQVYSFQDYNRFNTFPVFQDSSDWVEQGTGAPSPYRSLTPQGVFCDPQLGCSNTLAGFDISKAKGQQFSQEFRLQSDFDGPINFSIGANYTRFNVLADYYVMYNVITLLAMSPLFNHSPDVNTCLYRNQTSERYISTTEPLATVEDTVFDSKANCIYIDPNPVENIDGQGHNYFRSQNPYKLNSHGMFGEVYWQATDALKVTAGLRYNDDRKNFTPIPSQILLTPSPLQGGGTINAGYVADPDIKQHWGEVTGRVGVDWKPELSFTDQTMIYAFYSRGYKGGGVNPPSIGYNRKTLAELRGIPPGAFPPADVPPLRLIGVEYSDTFRPEFVNAFELGTKNTLFSGALTLNNNVFFYDYKDYQVSQIRNRTAVNENFDASIWGAELEMVFAPSTNLQISANFGYLDTRIAQGMKSIDIMNRTQGNPDWMLVRPWVQLPSNCIAPKAVVAEYEQWQIDRDFSGVKDYYLFCPGWAYSYFLSGGGFAAKGIDYDPVVDAPNGAAGFDADLSGNELPNSPHWTGNIGAQYRWDLFDGNWRATVRGDAYWQSQSWARVYNLDQYDKLHGWYNVNLSFWIEKPEDDLKIEFYVKNIMDKTPITDSFLNSDDTALTTNVFVLDPRLIGLQVTRGF